MRGWWRVLGLTMVIAATGVSDMPAASVGIPNCDGARMLADLLAAQQRGDNVPDERFAELMASPRFLAAAESGDVVAAYELVGRSIQKRDQIEAVRWLRQAAEHGHPDAQRELGKRYMSGQVVPQDYVEAARWYGRAAHQGNIETFGALAALHSLGRGVPQDFVEAHKWYDLAATHLDRPGFPLSAQDRDKLH